MDTVRCQLVFATLPLLSLVTDFALLHTDSDSSMLDPDKSSSRARADDWNVLQIHTQIQLLRNRRWLLFISYAILYYAVFAVFLQLSDHQALNPWVAVFACSSLQLFICRYFVHTFFKTTDQLVNLKLLQHLPGIV